MKHNLITSTLTHKQSLYPIKKTPSILYQRLAIGLVQGGMLYLYFLATKHANWHIPQSILASWLMIAVFVPLLFASGIGSMRLKRLWIWVAIATVLSAVLGYYDAWRQGIADSSLSYSQFYSGPDRGSVFFSAVLFFIAHTLIISGDQDRRFMAYYATYFDIAWKLGIQVIFSLFFLIAFWMLLWMGAALFQLIHLDFFTKLISNPLFYIPVSALVIAIAIHLTDVRVNLVRGTRTLILVLWSWLLPIITFIVVGFLLSLPFTGLEFLWKTIGGQLLLYTAAVIIILINVTYQDGSSERTPVPLLRYITLVAILTLIPSLVLGGYKLSLDIAHYGWTTNRIWGTACLLILAFYTIGYTWAAMHVESSLYFSKNTGNLSFPRGLMMDFPVHHPVGTGVSKFAPGKFVLSGDVRSPLNRKFAYASHIRRNEFGLAKQLCKGENQGRFSSKQGSNERRCFPPGIADTGSILKRGVWLHEIQRWNFITALLILGILVSLLTPIADPARIAVSSQMARLQSGKMAAAQFDFYYLRREGQRFGKNALMTLQKNFEGKDAAFVHTEASAA